MYKGLLHKYIYIVISLWTTQVHEGTRTKVVDYRGDFDPYRYVAISCINHCMC